MRCATVLVVVAAAGCVFLAIGQELRLDWRSAAWVAGPLLCAWALRESERLWMGSDEADARARADARLRTALEENALLLRELHHRVKNNLQVVTHLIELRLDVVADVGTASFLRELQSQARTIDLVYEQLYRSGTLSCVDMSAYLRALADELAATLGRGRAIDVEVEAGDAALDLAQAMPCGLAVNELVTNALKHAFPKGRRTRGHVRITLMKEEGRVRVRVEDDGVGLPAGLDVRRAESLGLKLVRLWVEHQLGGELLVAGGTGTAFTLDFPAA